MKLYRKQNLNVLYKVFFGSISIQKWLPWSFCQNGGTLYSGARYVALWASRVQYSILLHSWSEDCGFESCCWFSYNNWSNGEKAKLGLFIINLMLCANLNKVQRIRTYKGRINSNVSERQAKKICFKRYFKFVI